MEPNSPDHDLLLRVDTKLDGLITTVGKLEAGIASKADVERVSKLEERVNGLNIKIATGAGALAALQFALQFWLRYRTN